MTWSTPFTSIMSAQMTQDHRCGSEQDKISMFLWMTAIQCVMCIYTCVCCGLHRRSRQKVLLCRRIIRNESIISPSSYFPPPSSHHNPRTHHPHTVHVSFARTSSFQSSFFVSVCNLWNSLREEVVSLPSSRSLKAALLQLPSFILWCHFFYLFCVQV